MPDIQKPKPFYQSKSFWGSVIAAASQALRLFPVTAPFASLATVVGAALGIYGRATADGPLTLSGK